MTKPLISVIVPCYNVERYLEKCLKSITSQSYKNIEIVCVEDCSKDDTLKLLEKIKKEDSRIKVVKNKVNSGLAFSRNNGVKNASGKFISFIDSDDYVSEHFIEKLYSSLETKNADIAIANIVCVRNNKETIVNCYSKDKLGIINNGYAASACNKLFKKEMIEKYPFEVGKLNEDIASIIPLLYEANSISFAENEFYYYVQRDNSIQNSSFNKRRFDIFDGVELALDRIDNDNEVKDILVFNQLINTLIYVVPIIDDSSERLNVIKEFDKRLKVYDIKNNKYLKQFISSNKLHNKLFYKLFFKYFISNKYSKCNFLFDVLNRKLRK